MDDLEILRNSDDPVVRCIANHNEGYMIEELFDRIDAYVEYWTSWRGIFRMMAPPLIEIYLFLGLIWLILRSTQKSEVIE